MVLSTPIPMLTAATVTVITSNGIPTKPIVPITAPAERKFGIMPNKAKLKDLNKNKNITKIETKTIPMLPNNEPNKLCKRLLYITEIPVKEY